MADAKTKAKFRERNADPKQREHRRKWNARNPAVMRKISAKQRATRPDHVAARKEAQAEGSPAKHKCARCGARAVAAHHTSYNPPRHVWLCKEHHDAAHRTRPNVRRTKAMQKAETEASSDQALGPSGSGPRDSREILDRRKTFAGFPVVIESPAGSYRVWPGGRTLMKHDYGFIEGVEGADGDEYDCYLGPDEDSPFVFVIHQVQDGIYDEDKAMLGWPDAHSALEAYQAHRTDPFMGCVAMLTVPEFVEKLLTQHDGMVKSAPETDRAHSDLSRVARGENAYKLLMTPSKNPMARGSAVKSDKIPGGLADGRKPSEFAPAALAQGKKVEREHTSSDAIATEIAMDHLTEDPKYYVKLKQVEKAQPTPSRSKSRAGVPPARDLVSKKAQPPAEYAREGATKRSDYADPKNFKYPLHTEANVRAALSYFGMPKNRARYSEAEQRAIQGRIDRAARKHGIVLKSLDARVVEFFHEHPSPSDEEVHAFAGELGIGYDEFEEYLYELIGEAVSKGGDDGDSITVPAAVRAAARRGLEYRKRAGGKGGLSVAEASKQGIGSGVQRASNLIQGKVTRATVRRMHAFFSRHRKNKGVAPGKKPWEDRGHVAWLIWGGDPGASWAASMVAKWDREGSEVSKSGPLGSPPGS